MPPTLLNPSGRDPSADRRASEAAGAAASKPSSAGGAADWIRLAWRAVVRRRGLVIGVTLGVALVTALLAVVLPKKYRVECRLVAQSSGALTMRGASSDPRESPTHRAPTLILRRENLVNLVRETDLARYWKANRDWLHRLKDRFSAPPSDASMIGGMADSLQSRMQVQSDDTSVTIQVDWPDPILAYRLADAARRGFLETRHVEEVSTLAESAAILEGHAAELQSAIDASVQRIQALIAAKAPSREQPPADASARASAHAPIPRSTPPSAGAQKAASRRVELGVLIAAKQHALDELETSRRQRVAELQAKLEDQRALYTDEHPVVIELRQTLQSASRPSPDAARLRLELERLKQEADELHVPPIAVALRAPSNGAAASTSARISDATRLQQQIALDADPEIQYARSDLGHALEAYESLENQIRVTRIDLDTAQAAFRYRYATVTPPELPRRPIWPNLGLVIAMAMLGGLVIGVAGAIGFELRGGVFRERWQVERALDLPVLVGLPGLSPGAPPARDTDGARAVWVMVVSLALVTIALLLLMNGNPLGAIAPLAVFVLVWSITKLPLKVPALVMMFMILTLDNPAEQFAAGAYKSPLFPLAQLLQSQLKNTIPSGAFVFTGIDVMLVLLFGVHAYRRATGSRLDRESTIDVPFPMLVAAWACLLGTVFAWGLGLATGGSFRFSLWQIQRNIYLPLMFLLFQAAFPNPSSYRGIAKLLLAAACVKSVAALWIRHSFPKAEYATSHSDSMLFATVVCMLVIALFELRTRRAFKNLLLFIPLFIAGMLANDRRLVWVNLGFSLIFIFFMMPWTRLKIRLTRSMLIAIPFVLVYCVVGWGSSSTIFKPVATLRSMADSKSDMSTLWRDLENFNLVSTLQHHPVLGTGWGHPYEEVMHMPDVTNVYELEPYLPHNSIVGLFAYTGYVGFCLLWTIVVVGVYFAARAFYFSRDPMDRTAALTAFSAFGIYANQAYGDMGLGSWTSVFLIASALTIGGKLAVKSGAWSHRAGKVRSTVSVAQAQPSEP